MQRIKQFLLFNKFNLLLLILWLMVVLFTMFHHELWRDEAQAWCIVRDLNFIDICSAARTEGHPLLWYLILYPFAKFGFPVEIMQVISLFFVFISIIFLLFKSPFNNFEKFIICFSSGLLYFLPIVARNYSLIPIFLFMLALIYQDRDKKPFLYSIFIILLANTHILMLGFSLIISLIFSIECLKKTIETKNYKILLPLVLLFFNFLSFFIMFKDSQSENYIINQYSQSGSNIINLLSNYALNYSIPLFKNIEFLNFIVFLSIIVSIVCGLIKSNPKISVIFTVSFLYFVYVYAKVWFGGVPYQKAYILLLILVFCFWIVKNQATDESNKILIVAFNIVFILSVLLSPIVILGDLNYNFSGGKQIAKYIEKHLYEEKNFIIVGSPYLFSSISAYLPDKKFYSQDIEQYVSYFDFSKSSKKQEQEFPVDAKYYIVQENFVLPKELGFIQIYSSDKVNISSQKNREVFNIYFKQ